MEEEKKKSKEEKKKVELKVATPILIVSPIIAEATVVSMPSNDSDDHKGLMTSLSKLFEKKKFVKALEKIPTKVLDRV